MDKYDIIFLILSSSITILNIGCIRLCNSFPVLSTFVPFVNILMLIFVILFYIKIVARKINSFKMKLIITLLYEIIILSLIIPQFISLAEYIFKKIDNNEKVIIYAIVYPTFMLIICFIHILIALIHSCRSKTQISTPSIA